MTSKKDLCTVLEIFNILRICKHLIIMQKQIIHSSLFTVYDLCYTADLSFFKKLKIKWGIKFENRKRIFFCEKPLF